MRGQLAINTLYRTLGGNRVKAWTFALVFAMVAAADVVAQSPTIVVRGRVIDDQTRTPVHIVAVQLVDTAGRAVVTGVTNEDGRFQLTAPRAAGYRLRAERLGYFTNELPLARSDVAEQSVEVLLSPRPVYLDSVLVRARPARPLRNTEQLLHGRLVDDQTRTPIPGGTIELLRDGRRVTTVTSDSYGLFRLVTPRPGNYTIRAGAPGYRGAESPVLRTMLGDTIRFNFNLLTDAVLLAPIVVTASARNIADRSDQQGMEDLFRRMGNYRGWGQYITRDSIRALAATGYSTEHVLTHFVNRRANCEGGLTYLNGAPYLGDIPIQQMYDLAMLETIEYYRSPVIPADLLMGFGNGGFGGRIPCSATVFWLRRR